MNLFKFLYIYLFFYDPFLKSFMISRGTEN